MAPPSPSQPLFFAHYEPTVCRYSVSSTSPNSNQPVSSPSMVSEKYVSPREKDRVRKAEDFERRKQDFLNQKMNIPPMPKSGGNKKEKDGATFVHWRPDGKPVRVSGGSKPSPNVNSSKGGNQINFPSPTSTVSNISNFSSSSSGSSLKNHHHRRSNSQWESTIQSDMDSLFGSDRYYLSNPTRSGSGTSSGGSGTGSSDEEMEEYDYRNELNHLTGVGMGVIGGGSFVRSRRVSSGGIGDGMRNREMGIEIERAR
jgi:hypothetical protein